MSYIDRELLLIGVDGCISSLHAQAKGDPIQESAIKLVETTRDYIASLSAADVAEVVRCKNCRFFSGRQECYCHAADENGTPIFVREDDFCSYGARMDKEDEHEAG